MTTSLPPAYFIPDGDAFAPTAMAQGPWGPSISGNYIGGILGHAVERMVADPDLQAARVPCSCAGASNCRSTGQTPMLIWAYGKNPDVAGPGFDLSQWQHHGPKFVWLRDVKPLVAGAPMSPFTRAAMAGDVASSLTHFGTAGLHSINADYTLTLSRLPDGPDLGLAALTHSNDGGVGTGTAAMFDRLGLIGTATATTLINPGFMPPVDRLPG